MEYNIPISINKLDRFPILPPLITNDIVTEIQYYKKLAIAVEERLRTLEIVKDTCVTMNKEESNKNIIPVLIENNNVTSDYSFKPKDDKVKQDATSIELIMDYPTKDEEVEENLIDISTPINENVPNNSLIDKDDGICEPKQKNPEHIDKSISDDDRSCFNETLQCNSISSDTVTVSTDLNQYFNTSPSIKTDTTDTTPENWKPQVPKTLDIVPITVNKMKCPNKLNTNNGESQKLVRRGSYVLDAPSPMLLAHMHNETVNTEVKSPSSVQSIRCKEWNSNHTKTNWESPNKFKEPTMFRLNSATKVRKGSHTSIPSQRVCRSVSSSKTCSPLDVCQPTKSVDCIQAMFTKEFCSSKTVSNKVANQSKIYSSPVNGTNGVRNHGLKKTVKNTSILNLANRLSGSLGSLSNVSPKPYKRVERKHSNDSNLDKSLTPDSLKSNDHTKKRKPVITSEKIVTAFREIQDTHKREMIELVTRQQEEQAKMQDDFKKQQITLLAQIRKVFPEIPISVLKEAINGNKSAESKEALNSKTVNTKSESVQTQKVIKKKPQVNGISYIERKDERIITKLSTNCTQQSKELLSTSCQLSLQATNSTVSPCYQYNCQSIETLNDASILNSRIQLSNFTTIDDIPVGNPIRRHSNVSRQLFPLDGRAVRAPILDNTVYVDKHIKAATIINAYAKGFLVRRLMKTEKIIALKNTYKEALHCMLRLHVDEPLQVPEVRFKKRLQQQCDAASMNIVDLFSQDPALQMEIIAHDRGIKTARSDRPSSARSYSFATQRTLARKKLKEMGIYPSSQSSMMSKSCPVRSRCQTWTSNSKERKTTISLINQGIKRSTSAGAVRKPWR
ncbi:PREDICTED: uncharacterized protein LOC105359656 isoform X2 [Ceratosolen solmsi marchali]|nr:PREDICTED: uncharacterized protein LOC105359656 isoform X2 [Ceratosolen solmsi marchali]